MASARAANMNADVGGGTQRNSSTTTIEVAIVISTARSRRRAMLASVRQLPRG